MDNELRIDETAVSFAAQISLQDEVPMSSNASFDATVVVGDFSFSIANDVNTEDVETVKSNIDNTCCLSRK